MVCAYIEEIKKRVLVYGWYNKGNIGDESFKKCFKQLFPTVNFTFLNHIPDNVNSYHCIWFGGGDLFTEIIKGFEKIKIPIGIIGVGYSNIHPLNLRYFDKADLVITRDPSPYLQSSDLCFCLTSVEKKSATNKIASIFLNDFLTPRKNSDDWIRNSHNWFISEFSAVCDSLVESGYAVQFVPFCVNKFVDDRIASSFIIPHLTHRESVIWNTNSNPNYESILDVIQSSQLVVTQRLHGAIFSYINAVPVVSINHHDKMHKFCDIARIHSAVDYYGFTKTSFFEKMKHTDNQCSEKYLSASKSQWNELSTIITQKFNL